jgi:uncharacterized membrane protein
MEIDNVTENNIIINKTKGITQIVYMLQAIGLFVGITLLVGVIINYIKRDETRNTWLETHSTWQIRTFWYYLCFIIIGGVTVIILIGYVILFIGYVWLIYRICKGWIKLAENKPVY